MRVCVVGMGPWPLEPAAIVTGPSIRLRQFVEPLIEARREVVVVLLEETARESIAIDGCVSAASFPPEIILDPDALAHAIDFSNVDAVFGVGSLMPAAAAARLAAHLNASCWIDYFGDPLAELHATQLRQGGTLDTSARDHVWKFVRETLLAGDMFSTVSAPQRHALMGQLGLLGRFENHLDISDRLHEIPCAVPSSWAEPTSIPPFPEVLHKHGLDEGSRYIYFGGSWNAWLDEVLMAEVLVIALRENPELKFVCCGIPTNRAGEAIKGRLMDDLHAFSEAGRVIDVAPQTAAGESALLAHAGACLSLDRATPEAELGSRNRLLAMVRWGARPVVTVEGGLESLLVAEGLSAGITDKSAASAADELAAACSRSPEQREEDRNAGLRWLRSMTFDETVKPALNWVADGAKKWPEKRADGLIDRWAKFPAEPEMLFGEPKATKPRKWFFQ